MDLELLTTKAQAFAQRLNNTGELRQHVADHERRIARAQELLRLERIPKWTEDDLRDLFFDTDAFSFWRNKDRQFRNRLEKTGLKGFQEAFLALIQKAEKGLTLEALDRALSVNGLGILLVTELLCYRFPDRYWVYHENTRKTLKYLGEDIKQRVPRGEKSSDAYLYFAAREPMERILQAIRDAGVENADFSVVDIFLYELRQAGKKELSPRPQGKKGTVADSARVWIFQANPKRYDLINGLRKHRINDWEVRRYKREIQPGDLVLFWKAGEQRGIYGLGKVASSLYRNTKGDDVVDVITLGRLKEPILGEALKQDPILREMDIFRIKRGTNFRVREEEWTALKPMIRDIIPPDPDAIDARAPRAQAHPNERVNLRGQALANFLQRAFRCQGLHFTLDQIATFYTALQTKGFVILSGISGTGKTKLAQHFAALLPQPVTHLGEDTVEDRLALTVQPYMLKYARLIVPKRATRFFTPPAPGDTVEVPVSFRTEQETCRFVHAAYGSSDYLSLLFRGKARLWFTGNFQEGDLLYLEPQTDADGNLSGIQLLTADEVTSEETRATGRNWLFIPVRPDWRDSKALLGYYNPLTGTYHWTPFLRFVLRAARSFREKDGLAWFIILDEMNLARVEYYLGDLLSILESGRDDEGWSLEPLRCSYPEDAEGDLPPREITLPPNLYIMGTINVDETTHAISPKVLDRAFTMELTEADFSAYLGEECKGLVEEDFEESRQPLLDNFSRGGQFVRLDKKAIQAFVENHPQVREWLNTLNQSLQPCELHFGYRVFDEIVTFLIASEANGLFEPIGGLEAALDAAILMKVLPKFHGSRGRLEAPLKEVLAWCVDPEHPDASQVDNELEKALNAHGDLIHTLNAMSAALEPRFKRTAGKVKRMLWHLYTTGFAAF